MTAALWAVSRRPVTWLVVAAVTLATAVVAWRAAMVPPLLGNRTTAALLGSVQLLGPVALGTGAAVAVAESRHEVNALIALSVRPHAARSMSLSIATAPFILGYAIGALVVGAWTTAAGSFGSVDWLAAGVGALAIAIHSVVGYIVGSLLPYRLTPGIATVIIYLVEVVTVDLYGHQIYLLQPVLVQLVTAFWGFQESLFLRQGLWFCALLFTLALVAVRARWSVVVLSAALCIPAAIPVWQLHGRALAPGDIPFEYACTSSSPRVCVHPAYQAALPGLSERFTDLSERLRFTPATLKELDQVPRDGTKARPGAIAFSLDRVTTEDLDLAVSDFVQGFVRVEACTDDYDTGRLTAVVGDWAAGNNTDLGAMGLDPAISPVAVAAATRFRALTDTQKAAWLGRHWVAFVGCRITTALLSDAS